VRIGGAPAANFFDQRQALFKSPGIAEGAAEGNAPRQDFGVVMVQFGQLQSQRLLQQGNRPIGPLLRPIDIGQAVPGNDGVIVIGPQLGAADRQHLLVQRLGLSTRLDFQQRLARRR
jgi:hypothetical protein